MKEETKTKIKLKQKLKISYCNMFDSVSSDGWNSILHQSWMM